MHMPSLSNWATAALQALLLCSSNLPVATSSPSPPELSFLYTAYVECESSLMNSPGPHGVRRTIPIVGGNFTGPNLSGSLLPVPALSHQMHYSLTSLTRKNPRRRRRLGPSRSSNWHLHCRHAIQLPDR